MADKKSNVNVYVVTGGGGGMGVACAKRLGKQSVVLLADIDPARMEKAAAQLRSEGLRIEMQVCDMTSKEAIQRLAKAATSLGHLAGIVHTAGLSASMADWKRIIEVDLVGTALLLDAFLPLARRGTAAVCIASISGYLSLKNSDPAVEPILSNPLAPELIRLLEPFVRNGQPTPSNEAYGLAKRGVILLCEKLAPAWAARGARIVSISPGAIDTPMLQAESDRADVKGLVDTIPLKRVGTPEDIAAVVEFLLSEGASYITGTDLRVDGGTIPFVFHTKPSP